MGRRNRRDREPGTPPADFELERTLAAAEEDQAQAGGAEAPEAQDTRCLCGGDEFLLQAYLHVVDGRPKPEPVEVETLSCPQCGREYEAVQVEGGRVLRGELLGTVDLDDD